MQDVSKNYFKDKGYDRKNSQILSSIVTGGILGSIATPINAIKVPLQTSLERTSFLTVSKNIMKIHGPLGFYRGGSIIFCRDVTWSFFYFTSYDFINFYINNKIISSFVGGMISTAVTYPLDGMRLYKQHYFNQTNNVKTYNAWAGLIESFKLTRSNMISFSSALIRVPISITISHMSYLYYLSYFGKN